MLVCVQQIFHEAPFEFRAFFFGKTNLHRAARYFQIHRGTVLFRWLNYAQMPSNYKLCLIHTISSKEKAAFLWPRLILRNL